MRAAADDVLGTFSARHGAAAAVVVIIAVHIMSFSAIEAGTTAHAGNETDVYDLRVIFICDETSNEFFCGANLTLGEITKLFSESTDIEYRQDCKEKGNFQQNSDNLTIFDHYSPFEYHLDDNHLILTQNVTENATLRLDVTFHVFSGNIRSTIAEADSLVTSDDADIIIAIGNFLTVQSVAIVAEGHLIPILGYITEYGAGPKNVQGSTYVSMNPSTEAQGKALTQIIGQFNMKQTTVIIENSKYADGFLNGVRQTVKVRKQDVFNVLPLDPNISTHELRQDLIDLSNKGWKVIVLHCSPELMFRVVTVALSTRLYNSGYAWFLSEMAFSRDPTLIAQLPEGLLAIDSFWLGGVAEVMVKALSYVISATICYLGDQSVGSYQQVPYTIYEDLRRDWRGDSDMDRLRNDNNFVRDFQRCLLSLVTYCDNTSRTDGDDESSNNLLVDKVSVDVYLKDISLDEFTARSTRNLGPAFYLLNTIDDGRGDRIWAKVGYITASGERDLKTVLWPGHNIYGPSSNIVKTYRVVTRPAEPFVFISSQVSPKEDCFREVPCLQVPNSSQTLLTTVVDDFQTHMQYVNDLYTVHCCKGLALEMLATLAADLNFRYVIYFVNDSNYGTAVNDIWTGMVGDVINGTADIVAGAFSMTSERMNVMDFTEPFYQNKFSVVTGEGGSYVSIWAFLSPFSGQVWLCIFLSSIVAGVATAFLEWHSPFGLNPKGRKRTKNYSLGSGLLMVMVLLTGHTINIKAPKSWPGKVIQNVWAGLAIFIMTSYTANLAAYLAGQSAVTAVTSVHDTELLTKRVAVIPSSAVESFVENINPKLSKRAQTNYVDCTITAINMLRERTIDVYLDDTPLLEYALAKYDKDCKVRFAGPGKGFGSDVYAFGLARQSWLQIPMSNQILWYTESGYIQELARKYISRPQCEHFLAGTANPYGLEHTGGLFIILLSAIFISVLFLVLEHLAYRFLVPWLRKQPADSFWKKENFAFISQRVFRVVRSEKLYSQKQAAQEMIKIVKQRDFTRLIQKHELQKRRVKTQKRVKTKAEIFQEITANIISYHRQLQSTSEIADSSDTEVESQKIEDIVADVIDGFDNPTMGVNNAAYNGDKSDIVLDLFFGRRSRRPSNESDGNDKRVVFPRDHSFGRQIKESVDSPIRKLSSRSWCMPEKQRDESMFRKCSDSYILYPNSPRSEQKPHGNYETSRSSIAKDSLTVLNRNNELEQNDSNCLSVRMFHAAENGYGGNSPSSECPKEFVNALQPPEFSIVSKYPPPSRGNSYYHSPTSSSVHSPTEEKREFSPLSSPTSGDTDDFPECDESFGSSSTIPKDKSNLLVPHAPNSPERGMQDPDSKCFRSNTSSGPLIVIQKPSEVPLNPTDLTFADSNTQLYLAPEYESVPEPSKMKLPEVKAIQRSRSAGSFPITIAQNNGIDFLDIQYRATLDPDIDYTVVGIDHRRGSSLSDKGLNNDVFTVEGSNAQGVMRALRKSSDVSPVRRQSQQQQNNTRRTKSYDKSSSDYYKRNLRLKDNRVKSTLRRHAMSGYQTHLPADFIDEYTLEALSKEDVLILWKKSEIDLESKLHEVLARNRRLGLAIDYLTRRGKTGEPEEV